LDVAAAGGGHDGDLGAERAGTDDRNAAYDMVR
jgi:hypothetical protein